MTLPDDVRIRSDLGVDLVDALNAQHGRYPGYRAIHARGVFARGTFTANGAAAPYTRAVHLQQGSVDVLSRFSNGEGCPMKADGEAFSLGFATRFFLDGGAHTDLLTIDYPIFVTNDPETFLDCVRALIPDDDGSASVLHGTALALKHPRVAKVLAAKAKAPIASGFEHQVWWAVHTWMLTSATNQTCRARFRWEPVAGAASLERSDAEKLAPTYLTDGIAEAISAAPVQFDLHLTPGLRDDPDDPFQAWPDQRESVVVGRLSLTSVVDDADPMQFDPGATTDGISATDDPLLAARRMAYAESYRRRTS